MATNPTVGAFELLDPVSEGGMGTIWRARHVDDGDAALELALQHLHSNGRASLCAAVEKLAEEQRIAMS